MQTSAGGLFGRDRELDEADDVLAQVAAGMPQVLLVGGDAGIGKTTLVAHIGDRARDRGFTVLTGHCLDLDTGVSLQPVREALRSAVVGRPADTWPTVTHRMASFLQDGVPHREGSVIEDLGLVVGELADESPLLLVLEDMHWADGSTRDFAVSVSRTMQRAVCLVLTFRTDDLTRRHPFRQSLVEIGRSVGARRLDLPPLGREGIAGIVESCKGGPDSALVGALLARSEGNPLYAEELLQVGADRLPGPLNDLLLARVDALSGSTRDLLRLASVNGSRLDHELLREVTAHDDDSLDACLREAIDANVLRAVGEHLEFRHPLLREAVYDDLLPGERTRIHGVLAAAVQERLGETPGLVELGLLAHHWYAAHDLPAAYAASVQAGLTARAYGGPEAIAHLDRALGLFEQVPHPDSPDPAKADLMRLLAECWDEQNDPDRALALMLEAMELVDDDADPLLASRVYSSYARLCFELEGQPGHREAVERAIACAEGPPSEELATALMMMAMTHWRLGRLNDALTYADRAIEAAAAVPAPVTESGARQVRGWVNYGLGRCDAAMADYEAARRCAVRGDGGAEALWAELHGVAAMIDGLDAGRGMTLAVELRAHARRLGVSEVAEETELDIAHGLMHLGRLDEADVLLSELVERGTSPDYFGWRYARARLLVLQGHAAAALPLERANLAVIRKASMLPFHEVLHQHIDVLVANGCADEALDIAREFAEAMRDAEGPSRQGGIACFMYTAVAAARAAGLPDDDELLATADGLLDQATTTITEQALTVWPGTFYLIARALRADLAGNLSVDSWRAASAACARIGRGLALRPRLGLAAALLGAGERDEARTSLPDLVADARAMGAAGVVAEAVRLGHRHRVPLSEEGPPSRLDVLTAREREVLDVLSTGATNRAIAERLFISEKTVSVHVTNLLAKLGCANRGEAAALARELAPAD